MVLINMDIFTGANTGFFAGVGVGEGEGRAGVLHLK